MAISVGAPKVSSQTLSEEQRNANALRAQREALRLERREHITTKESKDRSADYVPLDHITRRVDQAGTEENLAARGNRAKLTGWSTVCDTLKDDGTADPSLTIVNEGLGQTHRGKLQDAASSMQYTPDPEDFYRRGKRGGHRVRGFSGANTGANIPGRGNKLVERPAPVKRSRVIKGTASATPAKGIPPTHMKEPLPTKTSSSASSLGRVTRTSDVYKMTQASTNVAPDRPVAKLREPTAGEPARTNVAYGGHLATPDAFMASIQPKKATQPATTQPVEQPSHENERPKTMATPDDFMANARPKQPIQTATRQAVEQPKHQNNKAKGVATAKVHRNVNSIVGTADAFQASKSLSKVDLMDLDVGSAAPAQSVIDFTAISDSVSQPGQVSQAIALHDNPAASALSSIESALAFIKNVENLQASGLLTEDMYQTLTIVGNEMNVRAKAEREKVKQEEAQQANLEAAEAEHARAEQAKLESSMKPAKASAYSAADMIALRPKAASTPPKVVITGSKSKRTREKTEPPAPIPTVTPTSQTSLLQEVAQRLTAQQELIVGEHVHKTRFQHSQSIGKTGESQLGNGTLIKPATSTGGPSPPAYSAGLAQVNDSYIATRTIPHPTGESLLKPSRPQLPLHLAKLQPNSDAGAAARAQYGASTNASTKASHLGPTIALHLAYKAPNTDPGAAARAEYRPTANASAKPSRRGPTLPPHLMNQARVSDPGAAARAQYGSTPMASDGSRVLSPVNGPAKIPYRK